MSLDLDREGPSPPATRFAAGRDMEQSGPPRRVRLRTGWQRPDRRVRDPRERSLPRLAAFLPRRMVSWSAGSGHGRVAAGAQRKAQLGSFERFESPVHFHTRRTRPPQWHPDANRLRQPQPSRPGSLRTLCPERCPACRLSDYLIRRRTQEGSNTGALRLPSAHPPQHEFR